MRGTGRMLIRAGDVITEGRSLKVTSGWLLHANSGDVVVGRALQASAAANSGGTIFGEMNFANPHYATSCLDIMYAI